jgi:hypothetical protein
MTDVDPAAVAAAEAAVAQAEANLAAVEGVPQAPLPEPAPEAMVHLSSVDPWHNFDPGDGLPLVTYAGTDVSATVAESILAAAAAANFPVRKR